MLKIKLSPFQKAPKIMWFWITTLNNIQVCSIPPIETTLQKVPVVKLRQANTTPDTQADVYLRRRNSELSKCCRRECHYSRWHASKHPEESLLGLCQSLPKEDTCNRCYTSKHPSLMILLKNKKAWAVKVWQKKLVHRAAATPPNTSCTSSTSGTYSSPKHPPVLYYTSGT